MATPTTPEEWLPVLAKDLDKRAATVKRMRNYCDGNAPLPEMGKNLRESWEAFQKKARVNFGGLTCRALKNRIRPLGVTVGDGRNAVHAQAERIWRDTRFATQVNLAISDRLQTGWGYLVAGLDDERAVVTREKPEFFIAAVDPLYPWKVTAALKVWRDRYAETDHAMVWVKDQRQAFTRPSKSDVGVTHVRAKSDDWELDGEPDTYDGRPPVVALDRLGGVSLIAEHTDAIDAINLGKLQRLVITAMQAFRQRALKRTPEGRTQGGPGHSSLPDKDADGNDIDFRKIFSPAPGALWDLPEGIDIWESQTVDIRPLLEGEKADRRDYAATTTTPVSVFIPEGQNQSAEGAAAAQKDHISLAQDEIDDIAPAVAMVMVHALRAEGVDLGELTVEIPFAPPALVSLNEQYAAASAAKNAGISLRTIMRTILGWSPEQIRQAEADLSADQFDALLAGDPSDDDAEPAAAA